MGYLFACQARHIVVWCYLTSDVIGLLPLGCTAMSEPVADESARPCGGRPAPEATGPGGPATAEKVAGLIAGLPTIGRACAALRAAGWRSQIAGNRITVEDSVFARYIDQGPGPSGLGDAKWVVYGVGECPAVRIVPASDASGRDGSAGDDSGGRRSRRTSEDSTSPTEFGSAAERMSMPARRIDRV